jgi:FUN14 family protein
MGMFLRRVLKFLVIIIGSFLGAVFLVIQWMQARQYIQGQVDWNRVGNDTMAWFQSLSAQVSSSHIFRDIGNSRNQWPRNRIGGRSSEIMRFLQLHLFHKDVKFGNIEGYDDIKDLVRRALDSDENYNLLLCGPPASANRRNLRPSHATSTGHNDNFHTAHMHTQILSAVQEFNLT